MFIENIADVLVDGSNIFLEQFGHEFLRKPDCFTFKFNLTSGVAVFGLIEKDFGLEILRSE